MTAVLRVLGVLLLLVGAAGALLAWSRLPEALPAGTVPEIVHVADLREDELPRSHYVHVLGGHLLPFASLALSSEDPDAPAFYLVPLVEEDHPLLREMERRARPIYEIEGAPAGDPAAVEEAMARWQAYASSRLDLTEVRLLMLSTDVERWGAETAVSYETRWVEGVLRPVDTALAPEIVALLDQQFAVVPDQLWVLYEDELPPAEETVRLVLLLGGLAALLGLAILVATVLARQPRWLHR